MSTRAPFSDAAELSPRVLATCRTYWRKRPSGGPAATCCAGCPLEKPCTSPVAGTSAGIDSYVATLNAAAEALP